MGLAQRLYREVGDAYQWHDRWKWSTEEWAAWVSRPGFGTWILSWDGELAGFFDLHWDEDGTCEVELFGLVSKFHGRGLGKHMLTAAAEIAFTIGAEKVWLHTCTLDDPQRAAELSEARVHGVQERVLHDITVGPANSCQER